MKTSRRELAIRAKILRRQRNNAEFWTRQCKRELGDLQQRFTSALDLLRLVGGNNADIMEFVKTNERKAKKQ